MEFSQNGGNNNIKIAYINNQIAKKAKFQVLGGRKVADSKPLGQPGCTRRGILKFTRIFQSLLLKLP